MKNTQKDAPLINERIKADRVRVIDEHGQQAGTMPLRAALAAARSANLDLVLIATGDVPVCKIVDAGKYMFEKKKHEREIAKRQRELQVDTKEVQLRPVTDDGDLMVKAKRARNFLDNGDKVKLSVRFRGREQMHKGEGYKIVDQFLAAIGDHKVETQLSDRGREWSMIVAPTKSKSEILREK